MPEPGQEETVRIVALDRSFHISCYKCEVSDGLALLGSRGDARAGTELPPGWTREELASW